jgi:uncharacterized membrane protein YfcA
MWQQYKKTLVGMQLSIAVMTGAAYMMVYRSLPPAAVFFAVMQVGAVLGAYWGARLKSRAQSRVW